MTIYAVGDIHGCLDKLEQAHARIEADRAREGASSAPLIHVGDLVDRGPSSAGVIGYLQSVCETDRRVVVLRGNHDQMFVDFLTQDMDTLRRSGSLAWTDGTMGGRATLASYGVRNWLKSAAQKAALETIPQGHIDFMSRLPLMYEAGDCLFVHAGIRPKIPLNEQDPDDLMWIRTEFLLSTADHGPLIVHGHTPIDEVVHYGNRLAIDTGAAFGGSLSAVVIEERQAYLLTDTDRVPVHCA